MHQQFNIQQLYALPTQRIYVFCIYLRTNSDLCHLQHKLIGFYNWDEKCLQRGTDWVSNIAVCASSVKGQYPKLVSEHLQYGTTVSHKPPSRV